MRMFSPDPCISRAIAFSCRAEELWQEAAVADWDARPALLFRAELLREGSRLALAALPTPD